MRQCHHRVKNDAHSSCNTLQMHRNLGVILLNVVIYFESCSIEIHWNIRQYVYAGDAGLPVKVTGGTPLFLDGPITLCSRSDLISTRYFNGEQYNFYNQHPLLYSLYVRPHIVDLMYSYISYMWCLQSRCNHWIELINLGKDVSYE